MPVTPSFTWTQTSSQIDLYVTFKGKSLLKLDLFTSDCFAKINYPPYLLMLDLFSSIQDGKTVGTLKENVLHVILLKSTPQDWPQLETELKGEGKIRRRKESLERKEASEIKFREQVEKGAVEAEHRSVQLQMSVESRERQEIDDRKATEKKMAEEDVYQTLKKLKEPGVSSSQPKHKLIEVIDDDGDEDIEEDEESVHDEERGSHVSKEIFSEEDIAPNTSSMSSINVEVIDVKDTIADSSTVIEKEEDIHATSETAVALSDEMNDEAMESDVAVTSPPSVPPTAKKVDSSVKKKREPASSRPPKPLPPPRCPVTVKINFTPRLFPTPLRDSTRAEEEDWLAKNKRYLEKDWLKKADIMGQDISERDPMWLKGKGDDFFRSGDVHSALNAYTAALAIDNTIVPILSNRSTCFLKIGKLAACIDDCNDAIRLLNNEKLDKKDSTLYIKLLVKKGTALCYQGEYIQAAALYDDAIKKSQPSCPPELMSDFEKVSRAAELSQIKSEGDVLLKRGAFDSAIHHYTQVLGEESTFVSCYLNRATCHLQMKNYESAVSDCDSAVDHLLHTKNITVPPLESDESNRMLKIAYVRQGMSKLFLKDDESALKSYRLALRLDPKDKQIQGDVSRIEQKMKQGTGKT